MNEDLRAELSRRAKPDQAARLAGDAQAWERADAENLPWLRQVITETGWPGRSAATGPRPRGCWSSTLTGTRSSSGAA